MIYTKVIDLNPNTQPQTHSETHINLMSLEAKVKLYESLLAQNGLKVQMFDHSTDVDSSYWYGFAEEDS